MPKLQIFCARAVLVAVVMLVLINSPLLAQVRDIHFYKKEMNEALQMVSDWQRDRNLLIILTLLVGVLGAATSALQVVKRSWGRTLVILFGAAITVTTLVKDQFFDEDYRALKNRVKAAREVLQDYQYWVSRFDATQDPLERTEIMRSIIDTDRSLAQVLKILRPTPEATSQPNLDPTGGAREKASLLPSLGLIAEAYAEQLEQRAARPRRPELLTFTGVGEDAELMAAKLAARENARLAAIKYLGNQFGPQSGVTQTEDEADSVARFLLGSGEYKDEDFEKLKDGGYRYYSQLAFDRAYLENDLQLYTMQRPQPVSPERLNRAVQQAPMRTQDIRTLAMNYNRDLELARRLLDPLQFDTYRLALHYLQQHEYEDAAGLFEAMSEHEVGYPLVWYWAARAFTEIGEHALAQIALGRVQPAIEMLGKPGTIKEVNDLLKSLRESE